jgi:hypothetical protein
MLTYAIGVSSDYEAALNLRMLTYAIGVSDVC